MKTFVATALVVLISAGASAGQDSDDRQTIAVRGHAEIRVVPDEVLLTLGVESFAEELEDAKADNDRRVNTITAAATFLIVHSLYKAALFLIVGILDAQTGTRDANKLFGMARAMPITAIAAAIT